MRDVNIHYYNMAVIQKSQLIGSGWVYQFVTVTVYVRSVIGWSATCSALLRCNGKLEHSAVSFMKVR